ncbi:aminotransferase class I/II-fold pyridoxal phosphate-dependent enzyme [Aedoeadaptatus urinae]|uniref:aminotransferase class I/II-fold pyridoxal phosphate-dependent enzyme n=1 Tax=Aedoeadaptatus urinae TaxID=1871017 RepID=UPI003AA7C04B
MPVKLRDRIMARLSSDVAGIDFLSDNFYRSVIDWMKSQYGYGTEQGKISYAKSAELALRNILESFTEVGSEVLILSSERDKYERLIENAGRVSYYANIADEDVSAVKVKLAECLQEGTEMIVLSNPDLFLSKTYSGDMLNEIAEFASEKNLVLVGMEAGQEFLLGQPSFRTVLDFTRDVNTPAFSIMNPTVSFNMPGLEFALALSNNEVFTQKFTSTYEEKYYPRPSCLDEIIMKDMGNNRDWLMASREVIENNRRDFLECLEKGGLKLFGLGTKSHILGIDCRSMNLSDKQLRSFWKEKAFAIPTMGSEINQDLTSIVYFNVGCSGFQMKKVIYNVTKALGEL